MADLIRDTSCEELIAKNTIGSGQMEAGRTTGGMYSKLGGSCKASPERTNFVLEILQNISNMTIGRIRGLSTRTRSRSQITKLPSYYQLA